MKCSHGKKGNKKKRASPPFLQLHLQRQKSCGEGRVESESEKDVVIFDKIQALINYKYQIIMIINNNTSF
jgi:hypothetical protein